MACAIASLSVVAVAQDANDRNSTEQKSIAKDGTFKFKLYNKLDALEKLARHLGLYGDSEADKDALAKLDKLIEGIDGAAKR